MPSFDIVSELDLHEVTNAVDQSNREVSNRFDFKGTDSRFEQSENVVTIFAQAEFQVKQLMDILENKLIKRGVDVTCIDKGNMETAVNEARQQVTLRQGLDTAQTKKLVKLVKDSKAKVQASIQGEKVRVNGKKRDDLQAIMSLLRESQFEMPLQFDNFRD
jgi:uncharacterized protein YajQ (UPF0234 family)